MANKHFDRTPGHPKAILRLGTFDVPCSVISCDATTAHVRVMTAGGSFGALALVREGEARPAKVVLRKQGPLGLDLWLDLEAVQDKRAA
jgi:hypothetical protein